jgi:hypothetical protein
MTGARISGPVPDPSGLGALWFGERRRASYIIAAVIFLDIIGTEEVGGGLTWPTQGNRALGGSAGYRERATFFICANVFATSESDVTSRPAVSSRMIERSVGSVVETAVLVADRRMNLSATFGFFVNMRRKTLTYFRRRR